MSRSIFITAFIICTACFSMTVFVSWKARGLPPETNETAVRMAIVKGFSLLQTSGVIMIAKSHCASCHHSTMTSMIAGVLAKKDIVINDTTAQLREMAMGGTLDYICNPNLNNQFVSAKFLAPYELLGLEAAKHPADFSTDIAVDYILSQALPDGHFQAEYARVPLECGDIHLTALSVRAVQSYAPAAKKARLAALTQLSKAWLEKQHPSVQQEIVFQLLGMHWCGSKQQATAAVAQQLLGLQNKDGGWSQLPTMPGDAYATGQALYALSESATTSPLDPAFQKGINYLLSTQDKYGAWQVVTRSNPIQPFVNTEFPPFDDNQFISAAASNWAVLALASALPDKK
jgi:Prenyltransferase and squalene oxidase repeat